MVRTKVYPRINNCDKILLPGKFNNIINTILSLIFSKIVLSLIYENYFPL